MNTKEFNNFLNTISIKPIPVIDASISFDEYIVINISEKNKDLLNFDVSSSKEWENYIDTYLKKNNVKVAFGGYLEKRNLYDRSDYFKNQSDEEKRNIHYIYLCLR